MTSISNIKIGRKITLVLGTIILLLTGLSGLSLWGIHTNEKLSATLVQRLTKGRLAERISGDTAAVALNIGTMIIEKKASENCMNRIVARKKSRAEAVEEFKRLADTPTSINQGAEIAELIETAAALSKKAMEQIAAGRFADAQRSFLSYASMGDTIRDKAREAATFQDVRAAEVEKSNKESSSTIWMALIAGSLLAIAAAVLGGVTLTRGIVKPLAVVVTQLDQIAGGDVSRDVSKEYLEREDEIGLLAKAMQTMSANLRGVIGEINQGIGVLSSSSAELSANSGQMSNGSRGARTEERPVAEK